MPEPLAISQPQRLRSVDILRGIVMVVMALDHCRDFFGITPFNPEALAATTPGWFLTRWVTHFCAPVFVFLAGTSAALYQRTRDVSRRELARFLISRGLWLIFVELVVVNALLHFGVFPFVFLQVIWVIGWSMILLAALIFLPTGVIFAFGLALVFGHNLLDGYAESPWGGSLFVWQLLHAQGFAPMEPLSILVAYPLLPWPGVMALGYVLGGVLRLPVPQRDKWCVWVGGLCLVLFIVLRTFNIYGEPSAWSPQDRGWAFSFLSWLRTTKYPPSLLFLLMTLGPALIALPVLDRWEGKGADFFTVFGRVPFFYYILHWFVVRACSYTWLRWQFDSTANLVFTAPSEWPADYEPSLPRVYLSWFAVVLALYPCCRWYMSFKSRHRDWRWLSYL